MINCAFVVFCNLLDTDYCCHQKLKDPFTHCDRGFFLFTFKCLCVSRWSQIPTWHTLTRYDTLLSLPVNKAVCIRDKKGTNPNIQNDRKKKFVKSLSNEAHPPSSPLPSFSLYLHQRWPSPLSAPPPPPSLLPSPPDYILTSALPSLLFLPSSSIVEQMELNLRGGKGKGFAGAVWTLFHFTGGKGVTLLCHMSVSVSRFHTLSYVGIFSCRDNNRNS